MTTRDQKKLRTVLRDEYQSLVQGMDACSSSQSSQYRHLAARKEAVAAVASALCDAFRFSRVEFMEAMREETLK